MARCAAEGCNARVEDGAVRCPACGANLAQPAAFLQTLGFVVMAISAIPFAIGEVVSQQGRYTPLIAGGVCLFIGLSMVITARVTNKTAAPTVTDDKDSEDPLM